MVSFKLTGAKSQEVKSGFEAYDGPIPGVRGFYRGVIKKLSFVHNDKGSKGFYIVTELEAAPGDPKNHAQFDGYPVFIRSIITETADGTPLKEGSVNNLSNFLAALGVPDEPTVVLGKGDPSDKGGVVITKIGGKNPVGLAVNIDLGQEEYNGETRPTSQGVYKVKDAEAGKVTKAKISKDEVETEDDEADLMDDEAETEEGEISEEEQERMTELDGLKIVALKKIAKELGLAVGGTKDDLVERILDAEFGAMATEEDEDDEESEEESEDEDVEAEDDEESEDEEEEEGEEEEEEEDERAERSEELGNLDRTALKAILKESAPDFRILKRHSDDELREAILDQEFGDETPF